jgi:hypothetical protein
VSFFIIPTNLRINTNSSAFVLEHNLSTKLIRKQRIEFS